MLDTEKLFGESMFWKQESKPKVYFSQWTEDNSLSDAGGVNNSVWSVDLNVTGDFMSGTETLCFSLPDIEYVWETTEGGSYPISDITFDSQGNMFLCEKTQGGWGAFEDGMIVSHLERTVLDCFNTVRIVDLDSNRTLCCWKLSKRDAGNNTTGGVAIGNKEAENGIDCEKLIWCTGDA